MPVASNATSLTVMRQEGIEKHQAIFHLDFSMWQDLIDAFDITSPMIPNRSSDQGVQVKVSGWYG